MRSSGRAGVVLAVAMGAVVVAALVAIVLLLSNRTTVIDDVKTEAAIEKDYETTQGKAGASVDCPSDVEVRAGDSFDCTVTLAGGSEEIVSLRIVNEDADVEITARRPSK